MNKASSSVREQWRRIVRQQKSSGLSVARFCRQRGIGESSLFAWKRRLTREAEASAASASAAPAFVLVKPVGECDDGHAVGAATGAIELHLGRDRHIVLRPGFDGPTLAAALAVLNSAMEGR